MILTVTPNPAIDMTYTIDSFVQGGTIRVDTGLSRAGGKGLNVARVARQTGNDVFVLTTAGGATGGELEADIVASGLRHRLVPIGGATRRSIAIVDTAAGSTTIMNERGAALASEEWHALLAAANEQSAGARCVVGSGSLPPGVPDAFYADLVAAARERELPVVIDAVGPALFNAAAAGASALKPNRSELREATGEIDPAAGARRLIDAGAGLILVSLGEDGILLLDAADARHPIHARLPRALDGNPTGAGDAAVAAVAACLADGIVDAETILRKATAWSAAAVLMPVAGEIAANYPDLENLLTIQPWSA
jgi:1-phosphofructokinase family hexose kinase